MAHQKEISGGTVEKINDKIIKEIQGLSHSVLWKEPKEKKQPNIGDYPALFKVQGLLHNGRYFLIFLLL